MHLTTIRKLCARPGKLKGRAGRRPLTRGDRVLIRAKTDGKCHVCGGPAGRRWQADHVVPHSSGGRQSLSNYLPICRECNRLRWFHAPKVIRLILRLGLYAKNEIRHETKLGHDLIAVLNARMRTSRKRQGCRAG
jgi:5-methylcytosine-specific restriction endonuclease McrA